jgi:xylulokinase
LQAGDASSTGLLNVKSRQYSAERMRQLDPALQGMLPPLRDSSEVCGTVLPKVARLLGLPDGVQVSSGSGDNMMSALGVGAVYPGETVMSLGTSGTLFTPSAEPIIDKSGCIAPFCDATGA